MKRFIEFLRTTRQVFALYWEISPGLTIGVVITQMLLSLQGISYAYLFGLAIDKFIELISAKSIEPYQVLPIITLFVILNVFLMFANILNNYFSRLLSNLDMAKIRLKQVKFMESLGISQLENSDIANKSNRFVEVSGQMSQHMSILSGLLAVIFSIFLYGYVVITFFPILAVFLTVLFVAKFFSNSRFVKKLWLLRRNSTEESRIAWTSLYSLGDPVYLKEIHIYKGARFLRRKFESFVYWFFNEHRRIRTRWLFFEFSLGLLDSVLYGVGIYFLIVKGVNEAITIGTLTFYLRSLASFSDQLDTLSYRLSSAIESSIRIQDAIEIFELYKPEVDGKQMLPNNLAMPPEIVLKNTKFSYPNSKSPVIESINLTIKSGEKIAIVGENGAGKTTLVKLLTMIYTPQSGEISIGGIRTTDLSRKSWYKNLGVLFQDFNIYSNLSVGENVHLGRSDSPYSEEEISLALKKADALEFVNKYPKKLNQILGERFKGGIRPSGGQWQKIAIARFFYRNAPVLILDEPTASIDAVAEAQIFDNIYRFMKGKTVIIISHRFSTVRSADRIIVLHKGKIVEDGSHEELLKLGGRYEKAFRLQAMGYN